MKLKINQKTDIAETLGINQTHMPSKQLKRYDVLSLVLVMVVVVATVVIWIGSKSSVTKYKTEQVRRGDLTVIVTATGTLQPTNTVSVGSELSGIIESVKADYNDKVKVGQILAKLDTSKLEAQLTQSKAVLESAKAKVLQAQATVAETHAKLAQLQKVRELSNSKVPRSWRWIRQKRPLSGQRQMQQVLRLRSPRLRPLSKPSRRTCTNQ